MKRPLIGRNVRLLDAVQLLRDEEDVPVEAGQVLKIINQMSGDKGETLLMVRTTEADARLSATGTVPLAATELMGTDDGELWGIDTEAP